MELPHIDRLLYLYSEANAEEPDVVSFWEEQIYQSCVKHRTFRFTAQALLQEFTVNDVYPSSLVPALNILKTKGGRIVPAGDLLSGEIDVLQSLFSSLWSSPPDLSKQICVPSKLLSDAQDSFMSLVATLEDRVVFVKSSSHHPPLYSFRGILAHATKKNDSITQLLNIANEEDSDLFLRYMINNGRAVLSADGEMVKFIIANKNAQPGQSSGFSLFNLIGINEKNVPAETISEAEEASLRLKSSIHQVETKVEELRMSIQHLLDKARKCKAENDTKGALFYLSSKRSREQARDRLIQSLVGLVEAQDALGQSNVNVMLANAYRAAAQGLKASRKEANLTAESAAEAMDAFQEEMDEMADINAVLTGSREAGTVGATEEEQEELEAELAALMSESALEDNNPVKERKVSGDLPVAPTQGVDLNKPTVAHGNDAKSARTPVALV
eukprot:gene10274-12026_t